MSPFIKDGDEVFIEDVSPENVRIGEVLYFKDHASNELTLHRLVKRPLHTKGDYSLACENNSSERLIGKAMIIKRGNVLCHVPMARSLWTKLFIKFSKQRASKLLRKPSRVAMVILAFFYWQYYGKSIQDHNEVPLSYDL